MAAIETILAQATAPGAGATFSAAPGNSLTIRDSRSAIWLIESWQQRQSAGFTRITSPLIHDAVVGMGGNGPVGHSHLFRGWQRLHAQDTLTVTGSGSAVAADIEQSFINVLYDDLPGSKQHLITFDELWKRGEDVYTFVNTLATGVAGGWSGAELIGTEEDQLKANREYAWLGCSAAVGAAAVRMTGTDLGNLGLGMPVISLASAPGTGYLTSRYWADLSRYLKAALIPVVHSANKSNTFIEAAANNLGVDPVLKTTFVLLAPAASQRRAKK